MKKMNTLFLKPFHSDGLSHTYWYNKKGCVNFVFHCVVGQNFYKIVYFSPEDWFYLSPSESVLFAKVYVYLNEKVNVSRSGMGDWIGQAYIRMKHVAITNP